MDDLATAPVATRSQAAGMVLQRLPLDRGAALRPLYLRAAAGVFPGRARLRDGRLVLAPGTRISTDTYFGAFFEAAWRGPTALRSLCLDITGQGSVTLRLFRRDAAGETTPLHETQTELDGRFSVPAPAPLSDAGAGRLFAEFEAGRGGCTLDEVAWRSPDTPARPVGLVPVFCTFGREERLAEVLEAIAAEPSAWRDLPRIVVVNQGRPGLLDHPAFAGLPPGFRARLLLVEQGNFGGCGGFTRGLMEARGIPGATHAVLMDDDVAAEPEALRRTAAFFAIAKEHVALGGHMLDMQQPTRLYEAGARVDPRTLYLRPLLHRIALGPREGLDPLLRPPPMHYNGWWYFALPLALLDEAGLPMPCFIRGDDVEFGLRLHGRGIPTVSLPGVAIWHEPFYAKLHGWQGYYELRNALVLASLHLPRPARAVAALVAKRLLGHLLTYRYHDAALVLRAAADWLRGPAVFDAPPAELHACIQSLRGAHPATTLPPGLVAAERRLPRDPRGVAGFVARLGRALLRNALVPTRHGPPHRLPGGDFLWFRMGAAEHVAVDTGWDRALPTFRRDRATFHRQAAEGFALLRAVLREGDAVAAAWRREMPRLTSAANWRAYLGLG